MTSNWSTRVLSLVLLMALLLPAGVTTQAAAPSRPAQFDCGNVTEIPQAECEVLVARTDGWASNGPEGGRIEVLAIDPQTPSTLYAGTYYGGAFKSTDGGQNWSAINTGLTSMLVGALTIDPQTPSTLYAGTSWSGGVFKSTDSGQNWSRVIGFTNMGVNTIAIDPQTPSTLYVGTGGGGGVLKSIDGGQNWSTANNVLTSTSVSALVIDPQTPSVLYAGTRDGVFKSTDEGQNWNAINTGLTNTNILVLVINPQTPSILYIGTYGGGVFKSINGGATWSEVNTGLPAYTIVDDLVIDPQSPSTIYAASWSGGVFKSTDGGGNWSRGGGWPALWLSTAVQALVIDPQTPSTLYVGTYNCEDETNGGVFKSTNGGENWNKVNTGLTNTNIYALEIDPQTPSTLYSGLDAGVFKSTDGGQNWGEARLGLPKSEVYALAIDPQTTSTLYAGVWQYGVFKSTDGGENWSEVNTGLTNTSVWDLALDPQTPSTIYAGTDGGVFKSTDSGQNWSEVNTGLTNTSIRALVIDPQISSTLYVGTYGGGVFKSTDSGHNWSEVNTGLSNTQVYALAIDPQSPSTIYAGTWRGSSIFSLFKSTDGGENWSLASTGLPAYTIVYDLMIDPQTPSVLYAAGGGVFRSTNWGQHWSAINTGLNLRVRNLAIDPQTSSTLYAGTSGGGVFKNTAAFHGTQTVVDPAGGTLVYTDTQGTTASITVPSGGVTETVTLIYVLVSTDTLTAGPNYVGLAFDLNAYKDTVWQAGFQFAAPVTVTITYSDTLVTGRDEEALILTYWDNADFEWRDAAETCTPPFTYTRDLDSNTLSVPICHLSRFALVELTSPPDECPLPLTDVSITGPTHGYTDTTYNLTASITPTAATEPITYTWTPEPVSGQGTLTATYQWAAAGMHTVTLRAENCGETITAAYMITIEPSGICPAPLTGVDIAGPLDIAGSLYIDTLYTFQAVITPTDATEPITYTWTPEPESGQGTAQAVYKWTTAGARSVTATVENCGGVFEAARVVVIEPKDGFTIYLPLVIRNH